MSGQAMHDCDLPPRRTRMVSNHCPRCEELAAEVERLRSELSGREREMVDAEQIVPAWPAVLFLNRGCPAFCGEWNCPFDFAECERSHSDGGTSPHALEECWRKLYEQQRQEKADALRANGDTAQAQEGGATDDKP